MLGLLQRTCRFSTRTTRGRYALKSHVVRDRGGRPSRIARSKYHRRALFRCLSSKNEDDDPDNVDIDRLAEQLSNAASNRRSRHESPFDHREEDFQIEDFEVVQTLGYLSVKMTKSQGPGQEALSGALASSNAAVVAFVANFFSGQPYQYPVYTLLKEYLPAAKSIAENEFRALTHLAPITEEKWEAASSSQRHPAPIVQLLGYFRGGAGEKDLDGGMKQGIWLVYKWEAPGAIWPWARSKKQELKARHHMLRAIFRGVTRAVTFCHEKGVVHGSLGTGSVLMNTFDDYSADSLVIILDNFGFASRIHPVSGSAGDGSYSSSESRIAVQHELRTVGMLFFETVIMSLTESTVKSTEPYLERLVMEIFRDDFAGLKEYIMNEPNWTECVTFLDMKEGAGWKLLQSLLEGTATSASSLHPFLE